ncbi:MAG: SDR family oxidoreductase [Myxococcota bacterium]
MTQDLQGKVFLVTGATEGIGKAAAMDFARRGATLTIVGRNREKTERVLSELKSASGNANVDFLLGDLSSIQDIRAVAEAFKARRPKLDVLVNNAGAVFMDHRTSVDGLEMTFALNHVGYFLLTHLLSHVLEATPGSRVVNTSSGAHQVGRLELATVARRPDRSAGFTAYGDSKLANILFTRELARRLGGTVTVNCFHPGFVSTEFGQNNGGMLAPLVKVVGKLVARSPEKGAETLIWLATSAEAARHNGGYFHDRRVARTNARARDDKLAAGLWDLSLSVCGLA